MFTVEDCLGSEYPSSVRCSRQDRNSWRLMSLVQIEARNLLNSSQVLVPGLLRCGSAFCFSLFGEGQSLVCSEQGIFGVLGECRWIIPVYWWMIDAAVSQMCAHYPVKTSPPVMGLPPAEAPRDLASRCGHVGTPKPYRASGFSELNVRMKVSLS